MLFDFQDAHWRQGEPASDTEPWEVRPGCHAVGRRNPASLLQCNTYVRSFDAGRSTVNVCIDPGSRTDWPVVAAKINQLVGDVGELHSFSCNHQDPDVVGNASYLCDANPNISAIMTEEVWRLAQHLDFQPRRVHFANSIRAPYVKLADRHRWQFVPTPFCHFRGAMAFYDPDIRTLFSGDLFGGLNRPGRVQMVADESDWAGIAQFHQIYMPTREALRHAVRQIRSLVPAVEVIAPQHGFVITGELLPLFLERLENLLVGLDLLSLENNAEVLAGYRVVLDGLVAAAQAVLGREETRRRLRNPDVEDGLERLVTLQDDELQLNSDGLSAIVKVFSRVTRGDVSDLVNSLRSEVLTACFERKLPLPPIGAGLEEGELNSGIGTDGIQT
jgi:serine/threonine-protein kinase